MTPHTGTLFQRPSRGFCAGLVVVLLLTWFSIGWSDEKDDSKKEKQINMLQTQINNIDYQIRSAESELARIGNPNWLCGCGLMTFLAVLPGLAIWYFTDIKPKEDRKKEIEGRIQRLQSEKSNLQNQIMILQM